VRQQRFNNDRKKRNISRNSTQQSVNMIDESREGDEEDDRIYINKRGQYQEDGYDSEEEYYSRNN
jgi:hypothetical protein